MRNGAVILQTAFSDSIQPGGELAPDALLNAVLKQPDPFAAMASHDVAMEIYGAFQSEFGFVGIIGGSGQPPTNENMDRLTALLRWAIREFRDWRETDDPRFHKLTALFLVAQCCDLGGEFWSFIPTGLESNTSLLGALEDLLRRVAVSYSARGMGRAPIWEVELVERFKKANDDQDWASIIDLWRQIEHASFPGVHVMQATRCLDRFGFDYLVRGLADNRQVAIAMQIASILSTPSRLLLGLASANPYVQFAAVLGSISAGRRAAGLTIDDEKLLAQILTRAAADDALWAAWMLAFNRYPMRYPLLQTPLGTALATSSEAALKAYIDTIFLYGGQGNGRDSVAACLRTFRMSASADQQKMLWRLAFARWDAWRFTDTMGAGHLVDIGTSALDYAIVGYALECVNEAERCKAINDLFRKLGRVSLEWHESLSDCTTEWNRLISLWQPFYHAAQVLLSPQDWLAVNRQYLPFNPEVERYWAMRSGMRVKGTIENTQEWPADISDQSE